MKVAKTQLRELRDAQRQSADNYRTRANALQDKPCSKLAKKIADALMESDFGKADRIQLRGPKEEDLGGYCRMMVERIIDLHLPPTKG